MSARGGRLSSWIIGIAHHRVIDTWRARGRQRIERGDSAMGEMPASAPWAVEAAWDAARQKVIFERALQRLRTDTKMDERTVRAFELCAVRGVPAEAAAQECGMTVSEVYVAKNRAIKKLRELVATLTQEFDEA